MRVELADDRWHDLRSSLAAATDRFTGLLLAPGERDRRVGRWRSGEIAAHVAVVAHLNAGFLRAPSAPTGHPLIDRLVRTSSLGDIGHLNDVALREHPERSPSVLAERLRDGVGLLLDRSADLDPLAPARWLGGATLPAASLVAHMLNEVLLHGHDLARARSLPWRLPSREAGLAFDLFLVSLLGGTDRGCLFGPGAGQGRVIRIEFRSPHTTPVVLVTGGGRIGADPPGGRVDARVRFEPGALMLAAFRRVSLSRAVATGRIVATGRRPWAAATYVRGMNTP
ncbi:maleylpyruvate isomerase N-terminal domain-containing protein [Umezawaea sp. NPDC059074]|uniref:maleylpyruvate isomerase N-terminal domain-containing protein n=1 Tax=Umezawaea sp. NPDC059074 TaxID=3346716 RepID=UPI0036A607AF